MEPSFWLKFSTNQFHATGLFLYPSEKIRRLSWCFKGYNNEWQRPVAIEFYLQSHVFTQNESENQVLYLVAKATLITYRDCHILGGREAD